MVLNRNRTKWFTEIEQAPWSPKTLVPGIEPSFDAARYKLGVNFRPLATSLVSYHHSSWVIPGKEEPNEPAW